MEKLDLRRKILTLIMKISKKLLYKIIIIHLQNLYAEN